MCASDFNEVLHRDEQIGGNDREQWQMAAFRDATADCDLLALGYKGLPCSWDNRQDDSRNVKAQTDRDFGDCRFLDVWGATKVQHVQTSESHHFAVLIEVRKGAASLVRNVPSNGKLFRYENMWQRHENYEDFARQAWVTGHGTCSLSDVARSLTSLQSLLKKWDKTDFGSVKNQLKKLREDLESERSSTLYRGPTNRERSLMRQLSELVAREEDMCRHRLRIDWLKVGGRNTHFFQAKMKSRTRTNRIKGLRRVDGVWINEQKDMENLAMDFYRASSQPKTNLTRTSFAGLFRVG